MYTYPEHLGRVIIKSVIFVSSNDHQPNQKLGTVFSWDFYLLPKIICRRLSAGVLSPEKHNFQKKHVKGFPGYDVLWTHITNKIPNQVWLHTYCSCLQKKSHVWVVLLLLSKFLQIKLVAATVYWKISLRVICKPTLLPPTFFHLCTCSMLHHPRLMWTWRASCGQGWALAMPAAGLCFGLEGILELVITRQHHTARSCRKDGLSLQAGFSDAGNL